MMTLNLPTGLMCELAFSLTRKLVTHTDPTIRRMVARDCRELLGAGSTVDRSTIIFALRRGIKTARATV